VRTAPGGQGARGDWLLGQGFAYARYVHSKFPGFGAAWAAWVADVEVNRVTGEVHVARVVVGQDAGLLVNPAGVLQQVHGNVLQTTSRALKERAEVDPGTRAVASREWGGYPILNFREVPVVDVLLMPRPGEPPLGVGESASVPGTAAIANAIFDATGVRLRQPPFTPEVVRAALRQLPGTGAAGEATAAPAPAAAAPADAAPGLPAADPQRRPKRPWAVAAALAGAVGALCGAALGWRPAIAPAEVSSAGVYGAELLERGRQLAALGDCAVCHTAPGGMPNAGGRAIETPFGTVLSTNLTPDPQTGLGRWSFSAFQRAMREGVSRDGTHLYPAFPYASFTRSTDDDLMALYAHLMSQPPVRSEAPKSALRMPYARPLVGLWNALHLQPGPVAPDPSRGALWNRGAYLVNGLGHCGACHTPRGALGAERDASRYLAGAVVDGWEAPALGRASRAPVPWSEEAMVRYLRDGHDAAHGVAAGPMAPVVRGLATLPDSDLRAIAHYLVALQPAAVEAPRADALIEGARAHAAPPGPAQRLFEGACGACHHDGDGPQVLGLNLPLALNTNLHSDRPDNVLRTILDGIAEPAFPAIGHMPAFRDAFDDRQVAALAAYLRERFAPGRPPWTDLPSAVARARAPR
jgi:nicotinate dehydrogenase subunit B